MHSDSVELSDTLEKKRYFNYDLMCTEFTIYTAANQYDQSDPFLFAQSFSNCIHVWWPTSASLKQFIISVNGFSSSQKTLNRPSRREDESFRPVDHRSWHIYFYMPNYQIEYLHIKNAVSLAIEPLSGFLRTQGRARMCRIALPGSDLYYEFEPRENGIRRAGIVTHSTRSDTIYRYIAATHAQVVEENPVKDIVQEILICMKNF